MIPIETAREIAKQHIHAIDDNLTLLEEPVASGDYGWVFFYHISTFLETNDIRDALAGNAPLLVDGRKGCVFTLGTAYDIGRYIHLYQTFGDPHAEPGSTLELRGWQKGAEKVVATREIKAHSQLGLKEAKGAVDACLEGQVPTVRCSDPSTAETLVRKLSAAGFEAKQLPR